MLRDCFFPIYVPIYPERVNIAKPEIFQTGITDLEYTGTFALPPPITSVGVSD